MNQRENQLFNWEPPGGESVYGVTRVGDRFIVVTWMAVYLVNDSRDGNGYEVRLLCNI